MWILPTKDRPERCQAAVDSIVAMGGTAPGMVVTGGGDYSALRLPENWTRVEKIGLRVGPALEYAFKERPNEPWYGVYTDDFLARTPGFEQKMAEAAGEWGIAAANDLWQGEIPGGKVSGCFVVGGELARAVGCLTPGGVRHSYIDDMWGAIGYTLGVVTYQPDVVVEHLHAWNNKAAADHVYAANYVDIDRDKRLWERWREKEFPKALERIDEKRRPRLSIAGKSLYIASPCGDGQFCAPYVISFSKSARLFHQYGVPYEFAVLEKCSILPHARNRLCQDFLKSDKSHMLFIDADMGWPDFAPLELLAHDKDVIAVPGVTKEIESQKFCVSLSPETLKYDGTTGLIRVKQVGTGFMMISRRCLERFAKEYASIAYRDVRNADPIMPRWFEHDLTSDDWGEDYTFCRRWREIGGEIWVDPSIPLHHVGQHAFTGRYSDALKASDERRSEAA